MASLLAVSLCQRGTLRAVNLGKISKQSFVRNFADDNRENVSRAAKRRASLKEQALAEPTERPFTLGKGALAGGAAVGIGALCYYGLGLSSKAGALDKSIVWPQYVKDRIKTTYMYFGSSLIVTAASALAAFQSPIIIRIVTRNGFLGIMMTLAVIVGTGSLAQGIEYKKGFGAKQLAWLLHTSTMGAMLAPMCFLGGPALIRAAWLTAGIVAGLSAIAVCAPSEKFLMMGGPLAMGLGVVFFASVGSAFLPPTTALGAGLYSITMYGGLLLFSFFLLHDTQRIIAQAERYPASPSTEGVRPYDPINAAMSIWLDVLNIFIRIATMSREQ